MINWHVRTATNADVNAICKIGESDPSFAVSDRIRFYERSEIEEWIRSPENNVFLVAEDNDRIGGFLFCKIMSHHWAMLDTLFVLPEFRGEGVANSMLDALVRRLQDKEISYLSAICGEEDSETDAWLRRHNFSRERKYSWFECFIN